MNLNDILAILLCIFLIVLGVVFIGLMIGLFFGIIFGTAGFIATAIFKFAVLILSFF